MDRQITLCRLMDPLNEQYLLSGHIVDGKDPAPPGMYKTLQNMQ